MFLWVEEGGGGFKPSGGVVGRDTARNVFARCSTAALAERVLDLRTESPTHFGVLPPLHLFPVLTCLI